MDATSRNAAYNTLKACQTLDMADVRLKSKCPHLSQAMRWGLWDGFSGKPSSLAGLITGIEIPALTSTEKDYLEGCEIGREISLREVPA